MDYLYVGTYTANSGSKGIYLFGVEAGTGAATLRGTWSETPNPSFLALAGGCLYAASEQPDRARVDAYRVAAGGALCWLNAREAPGAATCHVAVSPSAPLLFAANYSSGSVLCFSLAADGRIGPLRDERRHTGRGPDPVRQEGPHAHSVTPAPDGGFVLAADLGLDRLLPYRPDARGRLRPAGPPTAVPGGQGPRHTAFSADGRRCYLVTELGNRVYAYRAGPDGLTDCLGDWPILPEAFSGQSIAAGIQLSPDGRFLYASSRGWDGIAAFAVRRDGALTPCGHFPAGGRGPRCFCLSPDGRWLAVANQQSDAVALLPRDIGTGKLGAPVSRLSVPQAVCVLWKQGT